MIKMNTELTPYMRTLRIMSRGPRYRGVEGGLGV